MFIKDIKKAEVDLKLLNRDRRVSVAETEKLQRMIDRKKRHLDQQVIDDTGAYEKNKVDIENIIEWSPYMKVKRFLDESFPEYSSSCLLYTSDAADE